MPIKSLTSSSTSCATLTDLPRDVIRHIFNYILPSVSFTCASRRLLDTQPIDHVINLSFTNRYFLSVSQSLYGPNLAVIHMRPCYQPYDPYVTTKPTGPVAGLDAGLGDGDDDDDDDDKDDDGSGGGGGGGVSNPFNKLLSIHHDGKVINEKDSTRSKWFYNLNMCVRIAGPFLKQFHFAPSYSHPNHDDNTCHDEELSLLFYHILKSMLLFCPNINTLSFFDNGKLFRHYNNNNNNNSMELAKVCHQLKSIEQVMINSPSNHLLEYFSSKLCTSTLIFPNLSRLYLYDITPSFSIFTKLELFFRLRHSNNNNNNNKNKNKNHVSTISHLFISINKDFLTYDHKSFNSFFAYIRNHDNQFATHLPKLKYLTLRIPSSFIHAHELQAEISTSKRSSRRSSIPPYSTVYIQYSDDLNSKTRFVFPPHRASRRTDHDEQYILNTFYFSSFFTGDQYTAPIITDAHQLDQLAEQLQRANVLYVETWCDTFFERLEHNDKQCLLQTFKEHCQNLKEIQVIMNDSSSHSNNRIHIHLLTTLMDVINNNNNNNNNNSNDDNNQIIIKLPIQLFIFSKYILHYEFSSNYHIRITLFNLIHDYQKHYSTIRMAFCKLLKLLLLCDAQTNPIDVVRFIDLDIHQPLIPDAANFIINFKGNTYNWSSWLVFVEDSLPGIDLEFVKECLPVNPNNSMNSTGPLILLKSVFD